MQVQQYTVCCQVIVQQGVDKAQNNALVYGWQLMLVKSWGLWQRAFVPFLWCAWLLCSAICVCNKTLFAPPHVLVEQAVDV